jgi:predicted MPP superfamily phosphohydrolase
MRLFYQIVIAHIFLNIYVFYRGWKILPNKKIYKILFIIPFATEAVLYFIGFIFREHLSSWFFNKSMFVGTSWGVFLLYFTVCLLIFDIARLLYRIFVRKKISRNRAIWIKRAYYSGFAIGIAVLMGIGYYNYRHPVVNEKDIVLEKNIPQEREIRIVYATDLHIGYLNNRKILKDQVDLIMSQKPDIILLGGDIIDQTLRPLQEQNAQEEFRRLYAPYGVYTCPGNHEHYLDYQNKINWLKHEAGITVLQDSVVLIDSLFYVVGREDMRSIRKSINKLMEGVDKKYPVIVLNHQPNKLDEEADAGADIAFYGHTHNGQIFPINLLSRLKYELPYGYKKKKNAHIFVSSGLGIGGPQYRIGTVSEVVVVNLTIKPQKY